MDRNSNKTVRTTAKSLTAWHWNCNGFASKKAVLQQHIQQLARKPDIIMIQETLVEETRLPGYRTHASPPSRAASGKGRGVCTLVRKGLNCVEREGIKNSLIEHTMIEVITGRKRKESTFFVNIYSSPAHSKQKFKSILHKACKTAGSKDNLVICGDFNAPCQAWGYAKTSAKGRDLLTDATDAGLTLVTDPAHPTRIGNSVSRDTTPDLTFVRTPNGDREPV